METVVCPLFPCFHYEGEPRYIGTRSASMYAWFGTDLGQTTLFELTLA